MLIALAKVLDALEIAVLLPTDIPTRAQIDQLLVSGVPWSVSISVPTVPASDGTAERIEFRDLAARWLGGGRVVAFRALDISSGCEASALPRYAPFGR